MICVTFRCVSNGEVYLPLNQKSKRRFEVEMAAVVAGTVMLNENESESEEEVMNESGVREME